jgi:hypothetical protein
MPAPDRAKPPTSPITPWSETIIPTGKSLPTVQFFSLLPQNPQRKQPSMAQIAANYAISPVVQMATYLQQIALYKHKEPTLHH